METWLQYIIIGVILIIIYLIVLKLSKKDFRIEANKLINYLGGKDNIVSAECNMSRFKVILKDISFDNFIIKDGRCYGIDYDSVEEGMQYTDIAGVIAYAVTNCAGSIYSAFPFIKRILTNFRYQMIDVINEVRICLNSSKKIINIDSVLNDLLLIDDKKNEKFLQK